MKIAILNGSPRKENTAAIAQYKGFNAYTGIQDLGIFTATGAENKSEAKLAEIRAFAGKL